MKIQNSENACGLVSALVVLVWFGTNNFCHVFCKAAGNLINMIWSPRDGKSPISFIASLLCLSLSSYLSLAKTSLFFRVVALTPPHSVRSQVSPPLDSPMWFRQGFAMPLRKWK